MAVLAVFGRPAGAELLPDLGVLPPTDFTIGRDTEGSITLLMSVAVVNGGEGPLLIDASYDVSDEIWSVSQLVRREVRGTDNREIAPEIAYGGDGHDHLHVLDAVTYTFDAAGEQRRDQKAGFCFFDRDAYRLELPGAPQEAEFGPESCGDQGTTRFSMGLSVGWSDEYAWHLPGQAIDITGVPDGTYRVEFIADPDGLYLESNETNNLAFAIIELSDLTGDFPVVTVVETGTAIASSF